jgi:hypothetical protein
VRVCPAVAELQVLRTAAARPSAAYAPDGDVLLADKFDGAASGWLSDTFAEAYPEPGAPAPPPHGCVQAVSAVSAGLARVVNVRTHACHVAWGPWCA